MNSKYQIYKVGGAVRDRILGVPSSDNDYVVINGSEAIMKNLGFIKVGKSFPVFIEPNRKEEYALARKEKKIGLGYGGFEFETKNVTLKEDLERRDLTINAIAETKDGTLIDPFCGIQDLENRVLRHIAKSFREDPVRVLRLARFQSTFQDFRIAPETKELVLDIRDSGELDNLTKERISLEMQKMVLKTEFPYLFFQSLEKMQVLKNIFPYLTDISKLKTISGKLTFDNLISILSINTDIDTLRKELVLTNSTYKQTNIFSKLNHFLAKEFSAENLMAFFKFIKNIDDLEKSISLYNRIYSNKRADFSFMKLLFIYYRDAGKVFITMKKLSNKGGFLKEIRTKILQEILNTK